MDLPPPLGRPTPCVGLSSTFIECVAADLAQNVTAVAYRKRSPPLGVAVPVSRSVGGAEPKIALARRYPRAGLCETHRTLWIDYEDGC